MRSIAVDWSGAAEPLKNLWLAEANEREIVEIMPFGTRAAVTEHLVAERTRHPDLVVGLDFAFSLPRWFLEQERIGTPFELWGRMATDADRWLEPRAPFWSAAGGTPAEDQFRTTEHDLRSAGRTPTSVFKLVGASQVGRGSLRGMPCLARLSRAGFAIWPFETGRSLVVEIYPALLAEFKGKGTPVRIAEAVRDNRRIPAPWKAHAACSQDAFDAALSALALADHADELAELEPAAPDTPYSLEGQIWAPAEAARR